MDGIDRLGWTDAVVLESLGVRLGVRANDEAIVSDLRRRLPANWSLGRAGTVDHLYSIHMAPPSARRGVRPFHLLFEDASRIARSHVRADILDALDAAMQMALAEYAIDRLIIHAGVIAYDNRALVLPGRSFSGKSRLVEALLRRGATYYSDDCALLHHDGTVHPYPRSLGVRDEQTQMQSARDVAEYGSPGTESVPVGLIAFLRYRAGAAWRARPISPAAATLRLLQFAGGVRRRPEMALATVTGVVSGSTCIRAIRGEADDAAGRLLDMMSIARPHSTAETAVA